MTKYIILGHETPDIDSIVSGYLLEKLLTQLGYNAEYIIPDNDISKENIDLCSNNHLDVSKFKKNLPTTSNTKYILVDHHERDISGEIVAIFDHHPTDKEISCNYYKNVPSSSTSCLITIGNEKYFNKNDIKLSCLAAMVDTAAFHSDKTVANDVKWVKDQCNIHRFNYNDLLIQSLCITDITNFKTASLNGLKTHNINNHKIASSFVHLLEPTKEQEKINQMLEYLKQYRKENKYTLFAFIVHDITNFTTTLYKIYKDKIKTVHYNNYTARGYKIIPEITKELNLSSKTKTTTKNK